MAKRLFWPFAETIQQIREFYRHKTRELAAAAQDPTGNRDCGLTTVSHFQDAELVHEDRQSLRNKFREPDVGAPAR
ncbi:hypothetical protein [Bradyrhizobium sp. BR 1433]|uniref:hypothetical protein n=1 Tax=Bradyrhizobium sp. BR 1433 TaxID=3447967 RepID=UPI003EE483C6